MNKVLDRRVQYSNRFKLIDVSTGLTLGVFDFIEQVGVVTQAGTLINSVLFDSIDDDLKKAICTIEVDGDTFTLKNKDGIVLQSISLPNTQDFTALKEAIVQEQERAILQETAIEKKADNAMQEAKNAYELAKSLADGSTINLQAGKNIEITGNVISVLTTNNAEEDNTRPITSAGVNTIVGNIDVLLKMI